MPTYEYTCKLCGDTIEAFQSFSEKPLRKHPVCGGDLQKVFHARGVVFKGSGFYSTDSRSKSKTKDSEPAKKSESPSATPAATTASSGGASSAD